MDDFDLSLNVIERGERIIDALNECNRELSKGVENKRKKASTNDQ
ncbi:hypothetical protein [Limosilactobacillus coleohominis]|nr:hypothetical protein [Limosilactobacillus coleohominis]